MNQDYFKSWSIMTNEMQKPFQAMLELHASTLRNLKYLRPEELSHLRSPEEFINRNLTLAMENGQRVFELMQKSFQIFEHSFLSLSQGMSQNLGQPFKQARTTSEPKKETAGAKRTILSKKPAAKKTVKLANQKSQVKTANKTSMAKAAKITKTAVKAKPAALQAKLTAAEKKKNQPKKPTSKVSTQQKKKLAEPKLSMAEKKLHSLSKATTAKRKTGEPNKSLLAKKLSKSTREAMIPEKKAGLRDKLAMSLQKQNTPAVDPKLNLSEKKMPEPKINIPHSRTNPLDGRMGADSVARRFEDKNPFHK